MLEKDLSQSEYRKLSKLLDESLEIPSEQRTSWLAELARSDPQSASLLREMFVSHDALHAQRFLETRDSRYRSDMLIKYTIDGDSEG
jgi:hypothetical protein